MYNSILFNKGVIMEFLWAFCGLLVIIFIFTYLLIKLALHHESFNKCTGNCNQGRNCTCKDLPND